MPPTHSPHKTIIRLAPAPSTSADWVLTNRHSSLATSNWAAIDSFSALAKANGVFSDTVLKTPLLDGTWALPRFIKAKAASIPAVDYTIKVGNTLQGTIGVAGEHDKYKIALVKGQTVTFAAIGTGTHSLEDTELTLYNVSKTSVATDDDSGPGFGSSITYTATSTGNYFIDIACAFKDTGQYGLSVNTGLKPSFDVPMGAGALDNYSAWSPAGTGATVTYGFRLSPASYTDTPYSISTFSQVNTAQMAAVETILSLWSAVCGITFQAVNPGGYTDNASILIGNYNDPTDGAGAFALPPGSTASESEAGDLWLNLGGGIANDAITVGSWTFQTILHELGHVIGLSHPGDYNAVPGVALSYANNAQFIQDSNQYSAMSYFDTTFGKVSTPLLFDIYETQKIYGANLTTRTNDSIYGFGTNAGDVFDFSINTRPLLCLWDAGGKDTLNCSGFSQNQTIDLIQAAYSNIGGLTHNVSIALGTVIENAGGGSGNDLIIGNKSANNLLGGRGNDCLLGGLGKDSLTGGAGKDMFDFNAIAEIGKGMGRDTITDFSHKQHDKIDLSGMDANSKLVGNQAFSFIGSKRFDGNAGEIHVINGLLSGDTNGDKVADFELHITLVGGSSLVSQDFVL
jgi:serralysin